MSLYLCSQLNLRLVLEFFLKEGKERIWKEKKKSVFLEFSKGRKGKDLEGFGGITLPYFLLKVILQKMG